jgi:hypothetical protein
MFRRGFVHSIRSLKLHWNCRQQTAAAGFGFTRAVPLLLNF